MGQRGNLSLIAEDLGERKLVNVLRNNESWNQNAPTVIVAEGLMMYLSPEAVRKLFCQSAEVVGVGSRVAFTYLPAGVDGRPDVGRWTGLMLWLQKIVGEPWLWSIRPEELDSFLAPLGWEKAQDAESSANKYGVEYFAVAEKVLSNQGLS